MIISFKTLWKLAAVVLLAAICALLYQKFLRPADSPAVAGPVARALFGPAPEVQKPSALIGSRLESIFAPLESKSPAMSQSELRALRQTLADSAKTAPARAQQTAMQLCDTALLAIQERERSLASLADTRSKPHAAAMTADQKKELENKQRFFEEGVSRHWSETAATYRNQINTLRTRLGIEERQSTQAPDPETTTAVVAARATPAAGETIVLPRATPVRLKYGSTILPAGLRLRVVAQNPKGLTVDYSGEQVVVPWP